MLVHLRKVAAAEDLLGSPSEVKQWVKEAMGHELDVQRLSFLDASRMAREVEAGESSNLLPNRMRDEAPISDASRTIELATKADQRSTIAKWVAVFVGLGIILLAALLPDTIKSLGDRRPPSKGLPTPSMGPAASGTDLVGSGTVAIAKASPGAVGPVSTPDAGTQP